MVYDSTGLYTMGYDPHMPHNTVYTDPMNMYLSQSSSSSIPQNTSEVNIKYIDNYSQWN